MHSTSFYAPLATAILQSKIPAAATTSSTTFNFLHDLTYFFVLTSLVEWLNEYIRLFILAEGRRREKEKNVDFNIHLCTLF